MRHVEETVNKRWGLIQRDTGPRVGDEGLLSAVKPAQRRVAPSTHARSVVVEELVPFSGVIGEREGGVGHQPTTRLYTMPGRAGTAVR
jgi:hypothetical protein